MPIPLSQLSTWSNQGGTTSAQQTHLSIRGLLENKYTGINTYLQGSYRNSTNIYGESDVDIVVEGSTVFNPSVLSNAFTIQQVLQPWTNLNANIRNALISNYGGIIVSNGKKAIKIKGGSGTGRINADVITGFNVNNGLLFYIPTEYRWVLNYPKQHYDNGTAKNQRTNQNYKPIVRIFKNIKTYLIDNGIITSDIASSYSIECLVFNVPDVLFTNDLSTSFVDVLNWITRNLGTTAFYCQNGIHFLFGNEKEHWNRPNATTYLTAVVNLYNGWR
jgi:hypothetical protein